MRTKEEYLTKKAQKMASDFNKLTLASTVVHLEDDQNKAYNANLDLRARIKELEAEIRPAEGLPSYKELVERGYLTWALLPGESMGELKQKLKILLAGEVE